MLMSTVGEIQVIFIYVASVTIKKRHVAMRVEGFSATFN